MRRPFLSSFSGRQRKQLLRSSPRLSWGPFRRELVPLRPPASPFLIWRLAQRPCTINLKDHLIRKMVDFQKNLNFPNQVHIVNDSMFYVKYQINQFLHSCFLFVNVDSVLTNWFEIQKVLVWNVYTVSEELIDFFVYVIYLILWLTNLFQSTSISFSDCMPNVRAPSVTWQTAV